MSARGRGLLLFLAGCSAGAPPPAPAAVVARPATPSASAPAPPSLDAGAPAPADCIVVDAATALEGTLLRATSELPGARPTPGLVLRLTRPRCVVGLERAGFVTEVSIATVATDLRPLEGARVRLRGTVLGGTNEAGGPAVVLLAEDVSRLLDP